MTMLESSRRIGGHTSWPRVARSRGRLVVSPSSAMSRGFLLASVTFAFAASVLPPGARAYSSLAGSCDHAGVFHGVDRVEPQAGEGGYDLRLGHPGVNVPGATVPVLLTGAEKHKGMLVFAVNQDETATLGAWDASEMPDGCQVHPHCTHAATHDAFHNTGIVDDALPWIVPADLTPGTVVRFKITVVRDYETWYAFEREFVVGSAAGAGDAALKLSSSRSGAPGSKRAPGMGKAVEGGWHAPGETAPEEPTAITAARTRSESSSGSASDAPAATDLGNAARPVASGGRKADAGGVSGSTVVPASPEEARARRRFARLAHGSAMALCWLALAPSAMFVARHGKSSKSWFDAHRRAGMAVAGGTLASAWYITAERGWATPWGRHGKIGAFACALVLAQAAGGHYRKRFPRAPWARWHRRLGGVVACVGAYNCTGGAAMLGWMETGMGGWYAATCAIVAGWIAVAAAAESRRRARVHRLKLGRTA